MKNVKGITIIALVVTLAVLTILAGVSVNLILGEDGVISKVKNIKTTTEDTQVNEELQINDLEVEKDALLYEPPIQTIYDLKLSGEIVSATENTEVEDDNEDILTIPAGFKIASDSSTVVNDGIVIEDSNGNQFVWIPVASIDDYTRTAFFSENITSTYIETLPTDEQTSLETYNGYYIGRYEAGDSVSTASQILRSSSTSDTNAVSIKKGQAPYNYLTRDQSITLAEGIDTAQGYNATTKLCSSYAWDTAINFIQRTISNYGTSSPQGNYGDTTFSYINISGVSKTKASSSYVLVPTGQTTAVCNIYDMGGNVWEWTTEEYSTNSNYAIFRGSCYIGDSSSSAGYRSTFYYTNTGAHIGFRVTLYM